MVFEKRPYPPCRIAFGRFDLDDLRAEPGQQQPGVLGPLVGNLDNPEAGQHARSGVAHHFARSGPNPRLLRQDVLPSNVFRLPESRERIIPPMSDWSKVTRPIPVPNEWTKPFWDAARRDVLELQRCQSCGHFQHPPYATCTQCVATDLKFEPVRGVGTIYAYTIMYHTGDKRFASAVPYASIIVELDDAPGALLAGNLLDAEYTEAKVGRRVEVVFEKLNDDITLPQFRLAE